MNRFRMLSVAVTLLAVLGFVWLLGGGLSTGGATGSADAPPCDDVNVTKTVLHIFNQHPQYVGRSDNVVMVGLAEVREIEFRRHPEVTASANTRWCEAQGRFSGGATETVYWDMFSTRNLIAMYGVRPCFGRFDPLHKDCTFARPPRR
jgi:hypothetical protein